MEIRINKKGSIAAAIVSAILFLLTALCGKAFFENRFQCDFLLYTLCFVAIIIIGAILAFDISFKNRQEQIFCIQ